MSVNTIFGVNGVGKDTVANKLHFEQPDIVVTSMSRLYMYLLGITKSLDVSCQVSEQQYKQLEATPQEKMISLEQNEGRRELERLAKLGRKTIVISHLVAALRHNDDIIYLTKRKTPDWFIELNDHFMQLVAPPHIIADRRAKDAKRERTTDIDQILEHQRLCDNEWQRIRQTGLIAEQNMHIVPNIELSKAVEGVSDALF